MVWRKYIFLDLLGYETYVVGLGEIDVAIVIVIKLLMQWLDGFHTQTVMNIAQALHIVGQAGTIGRWAAASSTFKINKNEKRLILPLYGILFRKKIAPTSNK